jgi:hypothetical protein
MKKLFILAVAATLCFAVALPAMAKVSVGGMVAIGYFYDDRDGENAQGGILQGTTGTGHNGTEQVEFSLIRPLNQITVRYASDDNNVRGFIQIRGGEEDGGSDTPGGEPFVWNYAWIDWQITPNFYLRFGRQTQAAAVQGPGNVTGSAWTNGVDSLGFRNYHGPSAIDGIRAYIKFNDMIRMEIAAYNPDDDNTPTVFPTLDNPPGIATNLASETVIPRFDVAIPIDIAGWHFEPYGSWLSKETDQVESGDDDDLDIWCVGLSMRGGFGPFVMAGNISMGENPRNGTLSVGTPAKFVNQGVARAVAYDADNDGDLDKISDAETWGFYFEAGIKFGPARFMALYGQHEYENEVGPGGADNLEQDLQMYGVYMPISLAKGFSMIPEIMIYDWDDSALGGNVDANGNILSTDMGKITIVGVRVQLAF